MIRVLKIVAFVSGIVFLNALTTLLFVQSALPVNAGPQANNCVTGDVNGDFVVDLTDPIHLLGYIFEGSPEPVACAQAPSGLTANELEIVFKKYFRSPEDAESIFFPGGSLPLNTDSEIFSPVGKRFWITRLTPDCCFSPCGKPQVKVNGVSFGNTDNFNAGWFDGFLLEPGDVLEVNPSQSCGLKFGGYYID